MSVFLSLLLALLVVAGLIAASRLWFDRVQRRRLVGQIGIEVLAARHWRDGMGLLLRALEAEGYHTEADAPAGAPTGEKLLRRPGGSTLFVYKHGTAYSLAPPVLREVERRRQETEADDVLLATLGSIEPETLAQAARLPVRCLDGTEVWRRVEPLLDGPTREGILAEAEAKVTRPRQLATLGAAVAGLAIVVGGGGLLAELPTPSPDGTPVASSPLPAGARSAAKASAGAVAAEAARSEDPAARRAALAAALIALPEFGTAVWSSNTTLVLTLKARVDAEEAVARACTLAERYPELREVRLQIEAGQDVRWRRCG
ncbi:MAG: hypothetical protein KatS3mg128_0013 [Silanimonas sp.]|nr:MAG: hypothetical protein KatS3mg128_0013 [Silanimonas sp.]